MPSETANLDDNTVELRGDFYCRKCRRIKDYSDDVCECEGDPQ
jgi:hypothetical protein